MGLVVIVGGICFVVGVWFGVVTVCLLRAAAWSDELAAAEVAGRRLQRRETPPIG